MWKSSQHAWVSMQHRSIWRFIINVLQDCCTSCLMFVYYIPRAPFWPLFLKVNPPKQVLFQPKQGSFGVQDTYLPSQNIYIYIYIYGHVSSPYLHGNCLTLILVYILCLLVRMGFVMIVMIQILILLPARKNVGNFGLRTPQNPQAWHHLPPTKAQQLQVW